MQSVYFSHGGGPLPILGDPTHSAMIDFMKKLPSSINKPDAVLVVSAHWEAQNPTVLASPSPAMLYDYYGFPEEAYSIQYPSPGNPEFASVVTDLLEKAGIKSRSDSDRGIDHGVYIPMKMMYPDADIPTIQLSLVKGLDPEIHLTIGEALLGLTEQNILLIGSGFSFHNMQAFDWSGSNRQDDINDAFQDWLIDTCTGDMPAEARKKLLMDWKTAPGARYCHPREEHLLPLHVCSSCAAAPAEKIFDDYILGKRAVAFLWR